MQVSSKLFNEQSINRFSDISGDIQKLQSKIATGKNVLKASDDPVAMINISAAKEKQSQLERYGSNIDRSIGRLGMTETSLSQTQSALTRIYELSLQAGNDTYSQQDRKAIQSEIIQLKELIIGLANAKDSNGNSMFAGYRTKNEAFYLQDDGTVEYNGDNGEHILPISETMNIQTSLNGIEVFQRVKTNNGYQSIFSMIDNLINELESSGGSLSSVSNLKNGIDHINSKITTIGAIINKAEIQQDVINQRKLKISDTLSGLQDADIAKIVTEMQSLLVSKDAAQQSFMMITKQNLFDFIR
jgi:flagellar hook-associated protein 3 FlgL